MRELNQNQVIKYKGKNAIIIGFMNDGNICINQDGAMIYVDRKDIEVF
jgi:hypothetical protein